MITFRLYHKWLSLSRGFLKKFRTFFIIQQTSCRHWDCILSLLALSLPHHSAVRSALWRTYLVNGSWFQSAVFPFPPIHRGVSRCVPLLTHSLYHTLWGLSRGFFNFFSFRSVHQLDPTYRVELLSPLDILIIAHLVPFVKRFFQLFFAILWLNLTAVGSCCPLLTIVFYHILSQNASGNVAQLWEILSLIICALCLLTNCWGLWYNKISARAPVSEPPKKPTIRHPILEWRTARKEIMNCLIRKHHQADFQVGWGRLARPLKSH